MCPSFLLIGPHKCIVKIYDSLLITNRDNLLLSLKEKKSGANCLPFARKISFHKNTYCISGKVLTPMCVSWWQVQSPHTFPVSLLATSQGHCSQGTVWRHHSPRGSQNLLLQKKKSAKCMSRLLTASIRPINHNVFDLHIYF